MILDAIRGTDIEEVEVEFGTELIRVRLAPELSPEHDEGAIDDNRVADGLVLGTEWRLKSRLAISILSRFVTN